MIINILIKIFIIYILLGSYILLKDYSYPKLGKITNKYKNNKGLKIFSWNVKLLPNPFKCRKNYIKLLKSIIKKENPDVICIQECFSSILGTKTKFIKEFPEYNFVMSQPSLSFPKMTCSGLIVLSKYTIDEYRNYTFKICKLPDCVSSKGMLAIRIGNLWIVNTHLQDSSETLIQHTQLNGIKNFVNKLYNTNPNDKFILCGDFNINIKKLYNYKKVKNIENYSSIKLLSNNEIATFEDGRVLDLVFTNINKNKVFLKISKENKPSDHKYIVVSITNYT